MSKNNYEDQINIGKTRIFDGDGKSYALLVKNTISIPSAINLNNELSGIIEELGEDSEERLSLATFLKQSTYENAEDSYFGNMVVDIVKKPEASGKKKKRSFSPKNSKAKESSKDRINKFKQG